MIASSRSCSFHVSGHNLRADCQRRTLVPPFNSGANVYSYHIAAGTAIAVSLLHSAGNDVGCGSLETTGNRVYGSLFYHITLSLK